MGVQFCWFPKVYLYRCAGLVFWAVSFFSGRHGAPGHFEDWNATGARHQTLVSSMRQSWYFRHVANRTWLFLAGAHFFPHCLPLVTQLSPNFSVFARCFPDTVSRLLSLSFSACCLVFCDLFPGCGLPNVVSQVSPSCFSAVSKPPTCFPHVVSELSSKCLPQFPAACLPEMLFQLPPCASHLSPNCLTFVLQMWSSNCLPVCSKCGLPVISMLFVLIPHNPQLSPRSRPLISQWPSTSFPCVPEP